MKKILTLVVAITTASAVFAQSNRTWDDRDDRRDVATSQGRYEDRGRNDRYDNNTFTSKERDAQIKRINWEFDQKIQSVRKDRRLKNAAKNREIRQLEAQRQSEIRQVNDRYARQRNGNYNDRYANSNTRRY
jgi:hypothetical protein